MKMRERIRMSKKQSGFFGVITPIIAFSTIYLAILLHPWFSWADNALSDLGACDTSYNYVYNVGMIFTGIFGVLFSLNLHKLMKGRVGKIGTVIFGGGMIFLTLVGVFPSGTPPHNTVSMAFFTLCTMGLVVIGCDQVHATEEGWGAFTLSLVISGLSSLGLINTIPYELGAAIPEAIGAIAFSLFSIVFGLRLTKFEGEY